MSHRAMPNGQTNTVKFLIATIVTTCSFGAGNALAEPVEGFTEPYQIINVAVPETGILKELVAKEGDRVQQGDVIAKLDSDVHTALLNIAEVGMQARGRMDSAEAEVSMRKSRLQKLEILQQRGHARNEEVERARADLAIAKGTLLAVQEQQQLKKLEYEKILVQLNRRTVKAPLSGVINNTYKQQGEFVAPNDPTIASIVQLHPLTATFLMSRSQADALTEGEMVDVTLSDKEETVSGKVEFVSPTIDAESGTIRVKIRLENADGQFQSGERCLIDI